MVSNLLVQNTGSLLMALVSAASFVKLYSTYRDEQIHTIKHLAIFFGFFSIFQLMLGVRYFLPISESITNLIRTSSHIFLYVSLAYFSRIAMNIRKPEWERYVFGGVLATGLAATGLMVYVGDTITPLIAIPSLAVWLGMGTVFFGHLAMNRKGSERAKMALIAVGILFIAVAGPLHNLPIVEEQLLALIVVESFTVVGTLLSMAGVYHDHLIHQQ